MKLTKNEINFIKNKIAESDSLLTQENWREICSRLDDYVLENGYIDNDYEKGINDNGRFAERLIDKICYNQDEKEVLEIEED